MGYNPPLLYGPIATENNPPINPQYYKPSVFDISAISLGNTTTVTTTVDHNYVVGQTVRLLIPMIYGSFQLNEQMANVISIPSSTQVALNLVSTDSKAFVSNPTSGTTQPQIVAVGDVNSGQINSMGRSNNGNYIPGSFIDISPL